MGFSEIAPPTLQARRLKGMLAHHVLEQIGLRLPARHLNLLHFCYFPIDTCQLQADVEHRLVLYQ